MWNSLLFSFLSLDKDTCYNVFIVRSYDKQYTGALCINVFAIGYGKFISMVDDESFLFQISKYAL